MDGGVVGYLSGNCLIPYPFADGQEWSERPGNTSELYACFADAMVNISSKEFLEPRITNVGMQDGVTLRFDLVVGDHVTRLSIARSNTKPYPIASGTESWGSYVFVMSSEGIFNLGKLGPVPGSPQSSNPGTGFLLCPRCVNRAPKSLDSIWVYDGIENRDLGFGALAFPPKYIVSSDICFAPGNNGVLSEAQGNNGFTIGVMPGAGTGIVPCNCGQDDEDDVSKYHYNSQFYSDDGHARIFNDTCYDLVPTSKAGVLEMHAKCTACCTCDMYESIVNDRLSALFDKVKEAKRAIEEDILPSYDSAVRRFNKRIEEAASEDISVTITGAQLSEDLGSKLADNRIKGKMCRCAFSGVVVNNSFHTLEVSVSGIGGNGFITTDVVANWTDGSGANRSQSLGSSRSGTFMLGSGQSLVITWISVSAVSTSRIEHIPITASMTVSVWQRGAVGKQIYGPETKTLTV